ncbi:MAG: copper amine oxidase N-terminal protein [Anaerosolibacter sp.]|nr:copper amine oxidase N-terminal protein [Anaerosolibacter sp.]
MPIDSYAATNNSVDKVKEISEGHKYIFAKKAPKLYIEEENIFEFGTESQTFRLKLTNAEWLSMYDFPNSTFEEEMEGNYTDLTITRITDHVLEVTIHNTAENCTSNLVYEIPMLVQVGVSGQGPVTVEIDRKDSVVTAGVYTFAVIK